MLKSWMLLGLRIGIGVAITAAAILLNVWLDTFLWQY